MKSKNNVTDEVTAYTSYIDLWKHLSACTRVCNTEQIQTKCSCKRGYYDITFRKKRFKSVDIK